jgi:hypothetical protein
VYLPVGADAGELLRLAVTAKNGYGSAMAISAAVGPVTGATNGPQGGGGVTRAEVKAALNALRLPSGKPGRIGALLKHGFSETFDSPSAGRLVIDWYAPKSDKRHAKTVLVATVSVVFSRAGKATFKIVFTRAGRALLGHSKRLAMTAKDGFTPKSETTTQVTKSFTLKR